MKFDFGKLRYCLEPTYSRECLVRVFTVGAFKYEDWNWLKGMSWTRIIEAMERHLAEFKKGIPLDPETALRQLGQIAWGCYVLLEYERLGIGTDDRKMPTRAADVRMAMNEMIGYRDKAQAFIDGPHKTNDEAEEREIAKAKEKVGRLNGGIGELSELLERLDLGAKPPPPPRLEDAIIQLEAVKQDSMNAQNFERSAALRDAADRLRALLPKCPTAPKVGI